MAKSRLSDPNLLAAKEAAENANLAKSQFLAKISHELRTPMNGVLGLAELLLSELPPGRHRNFADIIRRSGEDLLDIIDQIIDLSDIESARFKLETAGFDLLDTVNRAARPYAERAREKRLDFHLALPSAPLWVNGDETRAAQLVANLLSNAVKFTAAGSVSVSLAILAESTEYYDIRLSVTDTGIGIKPELHQQVFGSFTQGDDCRAGCYGGIGLGLAIVRHIVAVMGGRITLDSVPGRGTHFTLDLTFRKATTASERPGRQAVACEPKQKRKILIVEDNPVNQLVIVEAVAQLGFEHELAVNGIEAVAAWRRSEFVSILMDCHMPVMDGFEATSEIRRLERLDRRLQHTLILALTANALPENFTACLACGMNDVLAKPFNRESLRAFLGRHIDVDAAPRAAPDPVGRRTTTVPPDRVIDQAAIDELIQLAGDGDSGLFKQIVDTFREAWTEQLAVLQEAIPQLDYRMVIEKAHAMKSSSAYVGAVTLSQECVHLEDLARRQDLTQAFPLLKRLDQGFAQSLLELDRLVAAHARGASRTRRSGVILT